MSSGELAFFVLGLAVAGVALLLAQSIRRQRSNRSTPSPAPGGPPSAQEQSGSDIPKPSLAAIRPDQLPKFADVGDLDAVKDEIRGTVGLLLGHQAEAHRYRITWNGVLLHGPAGTGKSLFARAMAGELNLSFIPVDAADLITPWVGAGPGRVEETFDFAKGHLPCLLFLDEFDALARRRGQTNDTEGREVLAQLLRSLEQYRGEPRLVVVAATNDLEGLDPAVLRPGRFDRHIRLDLPDASGRRAIFERLLKGRPVRKDLDFTEMAERTQGCTPAAIAQTIEAAALAAFREAAGTGHIVRIGMGHLCDALEHRGGRDRPTVEDWCWERLVLPERVLAELRELQVLVRDPGESRRLGVDAPAGVLLTGPPGTGKTTIAKVLAAEAGCSFYPVSGADVTSPWVGESERRIARLFQRARDNAPSIIFIDEIDALGARRGQWGAYDRQLDQLLSEIDGMGGQGGVFVMGATNRPHALDPALIRGGRLSRVVDIPLPDAKARGAILALLTARMPLNDVDLDEVAADTEGFSGGDLKALCQQAAVESMVRQPANGSREQLSVTADDFARAALAGREGRDAQEARKSRPLRAHRED